VLDGARRAAAASLAEAFRAIGRTMERLRFVSHETMSIRT
jgi:hypothetical protein